MIELREEIARLRSALKRVRDEAHYTHMDDGIWIGPRGQNAISIEAYIDKVLSDDGGTTRYF